MIMMGEISIVGAFHETVKGFVWIFLFAAMKANVLENPICPS